MSNTRDIYPAQEKDRTMSVMTTVLLEAEVGILLGIPEA